ncbi:unnamed protein product, partial [Phaeothamnion confervicola]
AELDALWLVGNVEHTTRHRRRLLLRELQDFVNLPGAGVLPGSDKTLATLSQLSSSLATAPSNGSAAVTEALSGGLKSSSKASASVASAADVGTGTPVSLGKSRATAASSSNARSALTADEHLRLRELERRLNVRGLLRHGNPEALFRQKGGLQAYLADNRKLRRVLRGDRPPLAGAALRSLEVDTLLKLQNEQGVAALRLQHWWRRHFLQIRIRRMLATVRGLTRLQAVARGAVTRRYVAEWYVRRSVAVLKFQTLMRRGLSNRRLARRRAAEHAAAVRIQLAERRWQAKAVLLRRRRHRAALKIQRLWRGCVARAATDRQWLDGRCARIQRLVRRSAASAAVASRRAAFNAAARAVQRAFRGFVARREYARRIWEAEQTRRRQQLRVLAAEEAWARENADLLQRRLARSGLVERATTAAAAEAAAHATVADHVRAAREFAAQRRMLSPRALEQGWAGELEANAAEQKRHASEAREACVFGAALEAREVEEELEKRRVAVAERQAEAARLGRWREKVRLAAEDRESRRRFDDEYRERRRRVADERRHWAIVPLTASGKPDKRPARAAAAAAMAAAAAAARAGCEKTRRRSHGGGNKRNDRSLAEEAHVQGGSNGAFGGRFGDALGARAGLKHTLARLQLCSYLAQVAQFEKVIGAA